MSQKSQPTAFELAAKPLSDPEIIALNVMWNRLISVSEEQANALLRVAFGAIVRESGDLSAGVFDAEGRMMTQAVTGTPGHVNTMARSVNAMLEKVPAATLVEGDVLVTNDPWLGAGHVFDFVVVTPVFLNGKIVAYLASTCHIVDIGGLGWSAEGRSVQEEGVLFPVMKLRKAGVVNEDFINIVVANSRVAREARGDIISLMSCNDEGMRRLLDLMAEYRIESLQPLAEFIFARSAAATREAIDRLPEGRFEAEVELDGYDSPIRLKAAMQIGGGVIEVDLDGSSPLAPRGINCPLSYSQAYASFGIKVAVAPHVPNNHASLEAIRISAPPGLIVSAERPAPVTARHVVGQALPDLMLGCLSQAMPGQILAESAGALWVLAISGQAAGPDAPAFASLNVALGGMGARPSSDGLSTTAFPSGVGAVSVEVAESVAPLLYEHKEFAPDSGGAGHWRGGLGQDIRVRALKDQPLTVSAAAFERLRLGATGRDGGLSGQPGAASITDGQVIDSKGLYIVPPGEALVLRTPGGGGFGAPKTRDPALVARDLAREMISESAASDLYGHKNR